MYNLLKHCINDDTFNKALAVAVKFDNVTPKLLQGFLDIGEPQANFFIAIMLDMGFLDRVDVVKYKSNLTISKLDEFIKDLQNLDLSKVNIEEMKETDLFKQIVFLLNKGKINCLRDVMNFADIDTIEALKYFYALEELGYLNIG